MTDQERQLLQELGNRVQKAPAPQVDHDADDLIRKTIGSRPDALYILTQTVLIQELALNQAKQQIDDLKRQQPPTSFLGNSAPQSSSGNRDAAADPRPQQPSGYRASSYRTDYVPPTPAAQSSATPPPLPQQAQYAPPQYGAPQYGQPQPSAFSGFLQSAAQTAAGVVAGEVAFSAISSLFGHHGGYYGGSGFFGGGGGFLGGGGSVISPVSETIINNNYYDENRGGEHSGRHEDSDRVDRFASDNDAGDYTRDDSPDDSTDDATDDVTDDSSDDLSDDTTDSSNDTDDSSSYDDGSDSVDV